MSRATRNQRPSGDRGHVYAVSGPRLLVVEDDPTTLLLVSETLELEGFAVDQARNGREALELFSPDEHGLVLTDVKMPEIDGFDLCQALRARPQGEYLPVLIMTGLDDHASITRAFQVGATDFITKPINFSLLGRRVHYILRASEAIRRVSGSERRLAMAQRIARLGQWDLEAGGDRLRISAEVCRILGLERTLEALEIPRFLDRVHPDDRDRLRAWLTEVRRGVPQRAITHRILTADARTRWVRQQVEIHRRAGEASVLVCATLQDITEMHQAEERIRQLASIDELTGLSNRTQFNEHLAQAVALAKRHGRRLALLFMDLDNFKRVNDTLGHAIGDLLLQSTAKRLIGSVRKSDRLSQGEVPYLTEDMARLGGDEFTLLLPDIRRSSDAATVATRMQDLLSQPLTLVGHEIVVTPSIGIAVYPEDGKEPATLLKHADAAMNSAKREGKNRYRFFDPALNAEALARLKMEEQLRRALENGELTVHYQPQFDVSSSRVCGVEALVRWSSPLLGTVPPDEFIPVAEETGLIVAIGKWVLQTACRQIGEWRKAGLGVPRVAVNISPGQFVQPGFAALVSSVLEQTGVEPGALELEVTESLLMSAPENAVESLTALKAIGVQIAIDDFGTGYSSLSRLTQFPIDRLKIDRSFVRELPMRRDDAAIASAVIAMADSMGLRVTAEGVENREQAEFLADNGCDELQGYYLGRPLPAAEVAGLLRAASPLGED